MDHIREHRSILAHVEKRLLVYTAARLPRSITSDHLTGLALVAMVGAGAAFAAIHAAWWSAGLFILALAANWFGDSLDGTVARVRNQQRPRYGYYVDHVVDLAGRRLLLLDVGGRAASVGLMTAFAASAVRNTRALYAVDPIPRGEGERAA